jgi:hypothetical protein
MPLPLNRLRKVWDLHSTPQANLSVVQLRQTLMEKSGASRKQWRSQLEAPSLYSIIHLGTTNLMNALMPLDVSTSSNPPLVTCLLSPRSTTPSAIPLYSQVPISSPVTTKLTSYMVMFMQTLSLLTQQRKSLLPGLMVCLQLGNLKFLPCYSTALQLTLSILILPILLTMTQVIGHFKSLRLLVPLQDRPVSNAPLLVAACLK